MAKLEELEEQNKKLAEQIAVLAKRLDEADGDGDDDKDEDDDEDDSDKPDSKKMKKQLDDVMADNAAMKKKLEEYAEKFGKLEGDKQASEKKAEFDKMLSEGRVVEAQREPFMKGDTKAFAELSQPVNLKPRGSREGDRSTPVGDATSQIREKAQKLLGDKAGKATPRELAAAYSKVLSENPGLRKQYEDEMAQGKGRIVRA